MGRVAASDLYLTVGAKPMMRVDQDLVPIGDDVLTPMNIQTLLGAVLTEQQMREFEDNLELNSALDLGEHGRFRLNILRQKHSPAMVIRRIITKIPRFEGLKLPPIYGDLAMERRGLVLVVGMTGSGKTTSLASMIDHRNRMESGHIITIEDPIEYYHDHQKSLVTQREIGVDTHSYKDALKNALRQRPDVILVGEIRDREVMEQALACSETGHLCLATVHANNAYQAIERVINFFPDEQAQQVRMSLAANLKGVLSQRLLKSERGGMVPVLEIMLNQGLVRELILKGEVSKIFEVMEKNAMMGMRSFDQSLIELYRTGIVSEETVINNADRPTEMRVKLQTVSPPSKDTVDKSFQMGVTSSPERAQEEEAENAVLGYIDTDSLRLHE